MARFMGMMERSKRFLLLAGGHSVSFQWLRSDDEAESMYAAGKFFVQTFVALNHLSVQCLRCKCDRPESRQGDAAGMAYHSKTTCPLLGAGGCLLMKHGHLRPSFMS